MENIKDAVEQSKQSDIEAYDASDMTVEDVLAQIEQSMENMDQNSKRRVVFTNNGETFEDVIDQL